jgi:hypothetical protein
MKRSTWILVLQAGHIHKDDRLMVIVEMKLHMNKDGEMEVQQVMEIDVLHVQSSPKNGPTMF